MIPKLPQMLVVRDTTELSHVSRALAYRIIHVCWLSRTIKRFAAECFLIVAGHESATCEFRYPPAAACKFQDQDVAGRGTLGIQVVDRRISLPRH